jgi:hypothetical protein
MNVSFEVRNGYLYVNAEGEFSLLDQQENLTVFMEKINEHGLTRSLCNITHITGLDNEQASIMTRFNLGANVVTSLPVGFRLAILDTQNQNESARFGETVMVNRGGVVKVTTSLEEALAWLGVNPEEKPSGADSS